MCRRTVSRAALVFVLCCAGLVGPTLAQSRSTQSDLLPSYVRKDTWPETTLAARAALREEAKRTSDFKSFTSDVLRRGEKARLVSWDVSGLDRLWIATTDGGDGHTQDHALWADAKLIAKGKNPDGSPVEIPLSSLKPAYPSVGWHSLIHDQDFEDRPLQIAGRQLKRGLFAHAPSEASYFLGGEYARLEASVGVSDTAADARAARSSAALTPLPQM